MWPLVLLIFFLLVSPVKASLKIGVVLPFSGKEAVRAEIIRDFLLEVGQEVRRRYGLPFEFRFYDSRGRPSRVKKLVEEAFFDGVRVLVGPLEPVCAPPLFEEARRLGLPLIITAGEIHPIKYLRNPIGPVFRTGVDSRIAVRALYRCLKRKGYRHLGLLITSDAFGRQGEKWLKAYATEYALKIVAKRYFDPRDTDVTVHLEALLSCEAVVCWAPPQAAAVVARNLAREALKIPVFFPHLVAREEFLEEHQGLYGRAFVGVAFFAGKDGPAAKELLLLLESYLHRYHVKRDPALAAFADALLFLQIGIRRGGLSNWTKALERAGLVRGLTGLYFLSTDDHYGLLPGSVGVYRYRWSDYEPVCAPKEGVL